MKCSIFRTTTFKKAYKKLSKQDQELLLEIIAQLVNGDTLEIKYKDHLLSGNHKGCRECHVKPDLLLIYKINHEEVELILVETGSHAKLFK